MGGRWGVWQMVELLTLKAASQRFSVPVSTLRAWIRYGRLVGYDKTLGKTRPKWLVKAADVMSLLEQHQSQPQQPRRQVKPQWNVLTDELLRKWGVAG